MITSYGIGRLTCDPETRALPSGVNVCNFQIASSDKFKDKSGELQERVVFIGVTVFAGLADVIMKCFKKGDPIFIQGKLQFDSWEDKETGKRRSRNYILLEKFEFIPSNNRNRDNDNTNYNSNYGGKMTFGQQHDPNFVPEPEPTFEDPPF